MTLAPREVPFLQKLMPPIMDFVPVGLNLTSNEHVSTSGIVFMRENGLIDGKRWGTVGLSRMPKAAIDPWSDVYPEGMLDCTEDFGKIRAIKSRGEIYALSAGSSIARTAVYDYLRLAKPGVNEMVLAADIDRQARLKGCESVSILTYAGKDGETMLRVPWEREFEEGDTVSAFMCVSYLRYYGAFGATTVIGGKSVEQDALFMAADNLFASKIDEMRRGAVTTGYEDGRCGECGADYYTVVNGVGMDLSDYPDTQGVTADVLNDMTFTVSLSVRKRGVGSVFISKNMLVTKEGVFPLSGFGI
jgi:Xaa-Pro aminopeptidase